MPKLTLYGLNDSVYTRIAKLALTEKCLDFDFNIIDVFSNTPDPHYLQRHPFNRIPLFTHGDFTLYETSAITRYIDEAFGGFLLQPSAPQLRARMNQVISVLDNYAFPCWINTIFVERICNSFEGKSADEHLIKHSLLNAECCLSSINILLKESLFVSGEIICLADLHAAPMLYYFSQTPEGLALMEKYPRILTWWNALLQRESVKRICQPYTNG
jgi:glutathione S-transferase